MEAVGIGCLWFARRDAAIDSDDEQFSPADHLEDIRAALEEVDNVSNVRVSGSGNTTSHVAGLSDEDEDHNFYPLYTDVLISFDIFVPLRLQEKYALGRTADKHETFHVKIFYQGIMPVTYIHYTVNETRENANNLSPSTAVVFIRKYLAEKLQAHATVHFQCLGPSPFWADVLLDSAKNDEKSGNAIDDTADDRGYGTLIILTEQSDPDRQVIDFIARYNKILKNYYSIIRMNNNAQALRNSVTEGAIELLEPHSSISPWKRFKHWRSYGEKIDRVFYRYLEEKMNRVSVERMLDEMNEEMAIDNDNVFRRFIDREITRPISIVDEDIRELLLMLEERRRGYFQNSATLFSGLAGGILGAMLGALLTFVLTTGLPTPQATPQKAPPAPIRLQNAP